MAWVSIAPALASVCIQPLAGSLSDRFGPWRIWFVGCTIAILSIVGSAAAPSINALIGFRLVQGFGTGLTGPSGSNLIVLSFPKEERAKPMSYSSTVLTISPSIGIILGGFLIQAPFLVAVFPSFIVTHTLTHPPTHPHPHSMSTGASSSGSSCRLAAWPTSWASTSSFCSGGPLRLPPPRARQRRRRRIPARSTISAAHCSPSPRSVPSSSSTKA